MPIYDRDIELMEAIVEDLTSTCAEMNNVTGDLKGLLASMVGNAVFEDDVDATAAIGRILIVVDNLHNETLKANICANNIAEHVGSSQKAKAKLNEIM